MSNEPQVCALCGKPLIRWQLNVMHEGEAMHIDCAVKDQDEAMHDDMDMGDK